MHFRSILLLSILSLTTNGLGENVPFKINLYESHIPAKLADRLILNSGSESDIFYERLFVDRKYQNGLDEYICEYVPVVYEEPSQELEPEQESDVEILTKASQLIHESFPPESCVWAYDFKGLYWTYAFCFADKIIQYHEGASLEERPKIHKPIAPSAVFVLGRFTKSSAAKVDFKNQASVTQYKAYVEHAGRTYRLLDEKSSPFSHHSSQRVVLQMVTDGTLCDMTRQPRTMELMYLCAESGGNSPEIMNVQEIKTCHYKMVLHVPQLCSYEPFIPNKHVQDSLVDVACQKIDRETDVEVSSDADFDLYLGRTVLRDDDEFPVKSDNRINIADHSLDDLGAGFYVALNSYEYVSPSEYFNRRSVVVFNGEFKSLSDLNMQFGNAVFKAIGNKLMAPRATGQEPEILNWNHQFVLWFELYDSTGEFLGLSRIENTGTHELHTIDAQIVDPVNFQDPEGEQPYFVSFKRPQYKAPGNMWNFEMFSEDKSHLYNRRKRVAKAKIGVTSLPLEQNTVAEESASIELTRTDHEPQIESSSTNEIPETKEEEAKFVDIVEEIIDESIYEQEKELDDKGNPHFVDVSEQDQVVIQYQ